MCRAARRDAMRCEKQIRCGAPCRPIVRKSIAVHRCNLAFPRVQCRRATPRLPRTARCASNRRLARFSFETFASRLGRTVAAACRCVRRTALLGRAWCAPCVSIRAASAIAAALSTAAASGGRTHLRRGQQNENRSHRHVPCRKHESPTCPRLRLAADRGDVARGLSFHPDRRVRSERARVTHEADGCRSAVGDGPQERSWPRVPPQPSFPRALRAPRARAPVVAARAVSRTRRRSVRLVQIGKPACAPPLAHRCTRRARDPVARPIDPLPRWINC